jgi:hypothetical protein
MTTPNLSPIAKEKIEAIATTTLEEILKLKNSHRLDIDELAEQITFALAAGYQAGMAARENKKIKAPIKESKTPIEQSLTDYLTGYTRNNPAARAHIINYPDWQRTARLELDRRAARLLEGLPDEEVRAIAEGEISLPELVRSLLD